MYFLLQFVRKEFSLIPHKAETTKLHIRVYSLDLQESWRTLTDTGHAYRSHQRQGAPRLLIRPPLSLQRQRADSLLTAQRYTIRSSSFLRYVGIFYF